MATGNIVWWSAGLTELLMSELKWKPLDDAVTRGAPPLPPPRAEQAACGHWAQLSHWIGTGTGPNFANIPVASEKRYLTSKRQPCPTHLISQHLTKSACDSEALKANTANMSGLLGGNDLHKLSIFTEDWLIYVCAKHVKWRNTWIKQQKRRRGHWDNRGRGRAQWCALGGLVNKTPAPLQTSSTVKQSPYSPLTEKSHFTFSLSHNSCCFELYWPHCLVEWDKY